MSGDQLNADVQQYLQAAGLNVVPPSITSDPLVTGGVPIEQLLRILGIAANAGDPQDNAESLELHAERDAITTEAAAQFSAQDEDAAAAVSALNPESSQLAQQVPQLASGVAGALAGALGGALQPLTQMPQQLAQGAQQLMQTGMGAIQQSTATTNPVDTADTALPDEFREELEGVGDDGGQGGGEFEGTAPTAMLGPPPIPSAGTFPSAAPFTLTSSPGTAAPTPIPASGVSGMPMVPPGAMRADGADKDAKPDAKRIAVPPVKNGAPVQGRITLPPAPVTKHVDGSKPVTAKRIIVPKPSSPAEPDA